MNIPEGEMDGETAICGQVIVPENWDQAGEQATGGENRLNITLAILITQSGAPFPEPIMYLKDGPGGTALVDSSHELDKIKKKFCDSIP
ncbi:MAG: hypothetical protein GY759_19555 [Chloroflexi bacterium]|nr:hypothetical protein [Chloroflexota bacterium]